MRKPLFHALAIGLGALALSGPAIATEARSVIELFTSQGCSSCPPADRLLGELARDPGTIALSFPVDYWDYIGWKDTFASPAYTARQKAYASARGDGQVYTPQAVVDGVAIAIGSDRSEIAAAQSAAQGRKGALSVPVKINASGNVLKIDVGAAQGAAGHSAGLWLLRVAHERSVAIGRGENSGHSVTYTNVVRGMTKIGDWTGEARSFEASLPGGGDSDGYVVLLQAGSGPILGAAKSGGI